MSLSNATENQVLNALLVGTDLSYRTDVTQYVALVTDVGAPSEVTPIANECNYTGYERVPITKATGWVDAGSSFSNAARIEFGKRTDVGTQTATAFVVVDTGPATGTAINMGIIGDLTADLIITQNVQPIFDIGSLTVTAE